MKPDKHKQKRTQQYKKKHGIKTDKEKDERSQPKPGRGMGPSDSEHSSATCPRGAKQTKSQKSSSDSDQSDDEFAGRRQRSHILPSNWERYEEIPDDDSDAATSRGADFSTLLQSSSGAVAQFRFADEIALEDDLTHAHSVQSQSFLTIDPKGLAAALNCIPLHKKLNLEEDLFEKEDLDIFFQEAKNHELIYEQFKKQDDQKMATDDQSSQDKILTDNHEAVDLSSVLTDVIPDQSAPVNPDQSVSVHPGTAVSLDISNELLDDLDTILAGTEPQTIEKIHTTNDDIDNNIGSDDVISNNVEQSNVADLTSGVSSTIEQATPQKSVGKVGKSQKTSPAHIEDDLDKLLSLDSDNDDDAQINEKQEQAKPKAAQDDLEDWLDSVLDS